MADHLITGTLPYVVVHCGNGRCRHVWEQAHTPLDNPGWNVCPECLFSASTNVARALRETEATQAERNAEAVGALSTALTSARAADNPNADHRGALLNIKRALTDALASRETEA